MKRTIWLMAGLLFSLSPKANALTQNNTTGLSQNMGGRVATQTVTVTATSTNTSTTSDQEDASSNSSSGGGTAVSVYQPPGTATTLSPNSQTQPPGPGVVGPAAAPTNWQNMQNVPTARPAAPVGVAPR